MLAICIQINLHTLLDLSQSIIAQMFLTGREDLTKREVPDSFEALTEVIGQTVNLYKFTL